MQLKDQYDAAVIGGGLAGLAAAIQLATKGFEVILFEKETYPFHKVCGEYISLESLDFLQSLGLPLQQMNLPIINTLQLTAPNGKTFTTPLPLGGFGISRYTIDCLLAGIARQRGVTLLENTRVDDVVQAEALTVSFTSPQGAKSIQAKVCCGAFGKRSNLDVKWKRSFITSNHKKENNYIGVKYHVQTAWPENIIGLHNFKDGYCGISKIEENKYCLCYLTTAQNLKDCNNSINLLQQNVLSKNPALQQIFKQAKVQEGFPVTIAQISFSKKAPTEHGILMLGDAAGMITPLCGNGMSIALHTSKIAAALIEKYLQQQIDFKELQRGYQQQWNQYFKNRLRAGRLLQRFFGKNVTSNLFVQLFATFPSLAGAVIKKTHGSPF